MDKLDHSLDGGPKIDEVFHLSTADVREHVNVKNAVDFTKELLRTETSPPKIEGRSQKTKRKSASLQPKPMPKKKNFFNGDECTIRSMVEVSCSQVNQCQFSKKVIFVPLKV